MNDYKELIDELRWLAFTYKGNIIDDEDKVVIGKAAKAIEELTKKYIKSETDATTLTGELAQAYAYIDRLKKDKQELQEVINEVAL
jgi:two-component SAPR family response regulator